MRINLSLLELLNKHGLNESTCPSEQHQWQAFIQELSQKLDPTDGSTSIDENKENEKNRLKLVNSARMAILGEMAGGIAHEVNNPLAIIQGLSQQVVFKANTSPLTNEFVLEKIEKILQNTQRIVKIIKGLRAFARDSDNEPLQMYTAKELVEDTLNLCQERARKRNIELILPHHYPEISFECHPTQISQVLFNLISNSYDAISELPEKWIKIEVLKHPQFFEVLVTDSGNGIPIELHSKILMPFFTTKDVGQGTGLGLSTSKGLIDQHNGVLKIDTNCKNTRFVILLPYTQPKQPAFKVRHTA